MGAKIIAIALLVSACNSHPIPKGRALYQSYCTGCHNADPRLPGSIGPELSTTPTTVIQTKVLHGYYPFGYTPKRGSRAMPKFPFLLDDIAEIEKYIKNP